MESAGVISISVYPTGLPVEYYIQLLIKLAIRWWINIRHLEAVLKSDVKPTAIKPNNEELSVIGSRVSKDLDELKAVLSEPLFEESEWMHRILGADGALLKHWDTFI